MNVVSILYISLFPTLQCYVQAKSEHTHTDVEIKATAAELYRWSWINQSGGEKN